MSVGFIMYEIVDKDSLKNQGINTNKDKKYSVEQLDILLNIKALTPNSYLAVILDELDIHLKIKALTPEKRLRYARSLLDIHLKIKVLTPCRAEFDEFQPFITKIK